jgi:nitroreductase
MNAIFTRRSIRKYTDAPVSEELLEKILKAGMAAPSAGNEQPWHFIILNDKKLLTEIPKFHPYSHMLNHANQAIVVCADLSVIRYEGYWIQDCSAATQNILLMAEDLGLGAVWLGVYPTEDRVKSMKELLGLPENIIPFSIVAIGYPDETKEPVERFDPSRIHRNQW